MKVKVKINESIAGLADPDRDRLDAKYARLAQEYKAREKPPSERQIANTIGELKLADRYAEKPLGFRKDWSFRPGDEAFIEAELAEKWAEAGICAILDSKKAAAA